MAENARGGLGRIVFAVATVFAVIFFIENPIVRLVLALAAMALGVSALSRRWSMRLADIIILLPPW